MTAQGTPPASTHTRALANLATCRDLVLAEGPRIHAAAAAMRAALDLVWASHGNIAAARIAEMKIAAEALAASVDASSPIATLAGELDAAHAALSAPDVDLIGPP